MSFRAVAWALEQRTNGLAAQMVLVILANHAARDGTCFPTQQQIAEQARCSVRHVKRALVLLQRGGFIESEQRWRKGGKGKMASIYKLLMPDVNETIGANRSPMTGIRANRSPMVGAKGTNMTGIRANRSPISKEEPITEPITKERARAREESMDFSKGFKSLSETLAATVAEVGKPPRNSGRN